MKQNKTIGDDRVARDGIVNLETGEILKKIYEGDKVKVTSEKDRGKTELSEQDKNFNAGVPFTKLYKGMKEMRKILTTGEFTIAISLSDYVCYEDCIIRRGGTHKGKILTTKELATDMEVDYNSLRKTITSLVKKGVLGIHKTGCKDKPNVMVKAITVNPYIYTRGKCVNNTAISLFEHTNWGKEIKNKD